MKIYQCPEWCVGDVHAKREDYYFIIKSNTMGFTYKDSRFGSQREEDILNSTDKFILEKEEDEDISGS